MAFFLGDVNGENAHDAAGELIGRAGQEWAEQHVSCIAQHSHSAHSAP